MLRNGWPKRNEESRWIRRRKPTRPRKTRPPPEWWPKTSGKRPTGLAWTRKKPKGIAVQEREKAVDAKEDADRQRDKAEYQAYIALIGLAAARIDENAFDTARQLLQQCPPRLRHWEWGRLMHMCQLSVRDYHVASPIETLALAPDGSLLVGGWNGLAQILKEADGSLRHSLPQAALSFVYASAVSPDGRFAALGTSDRGQGFLTLWDTRSGQTRS